MSTSDPTRMDRRDAIKWMLAAAASVSARARMRARYTRPTATTSSTRPM